MPRPPADGLYAVTRTDGQVLLIQYGQGGRVQEALTTRTTNLPKRRTTRYLAPNFAEWLYEHRRKVEEARIRAIMDLRTSPRG